MLEMHDTENTVLGLPGTSTAWPDFRKISVVIETTCDSTDISTEISEPLSNCFRELHPDFSNGPWVLVRLSTDKILPKDFDLNKVLLDSGITVNMVPNIVEHEAPGSYELVVAEPCLGLLSSNLHGFKLAVGYDPFAPAEDDIRIYGIVEAKKRARVRSLSNAAKAIRKGWQPGAEECYRDAAGRVGLETALERAILDWDIQEAESRVLEHFTQNLLFLCLNLSQDYDILLGRDQNDWLQPFRSSHTDIFELLNAADVPIRMLERSKQQKTSLFRNVFEFSGGRVDCRQHMFDLDYTASQNASLCASHLGVFCSRRFGHFDREEMHSALSRSNLFAETSSAKVPDTLEWSLRMMASCPVGFPDDHLNLPSQLLNGLGAKQVELINVYLEQVYRRRPSIRKPENNILLFLTWNSTYQGQTLRVLSEWMRSEESVRLCQQLIEDLWAQKTIEELGLTLAALLCRERLLPYTKSDSAYPIWGSYLADLDAILNDQDINKRRTVFEQMISSLLRVLYTLKDDNEDTIQLLADVLDKEASLLEPLDGVADQYWSRRIPGLFNHKKAYEEAREGLLRSMEAMLKRDWNADGEWVVNPRSPLRLVSS